MKYSRLTAPAPSCLRTAEQSRDTPAVCHPTRTERGCDARGRGGSGDNVSSCYVIDWRHLRAICHIIPSCPPPGQKHSTALDLVGKHQSSIVKGHENCGGVIFTSGSASLILFSKYCCRSWQWVWSSLYPDWVARAGSW